MPAEGYRSFLPWENDPSLLAHRAGPDDRSGAVYLHDRRLQLAAETAIVTQRPLLLRGEPGCGKSSFAPFAARNLGWRYYDKTIGARTEARDLLWHFDALRRLRDAQAGAEEIDSRQYVTPGVLWWAFNRENALAFVGERKDVTEPFADINTGRDPERAVVLLDEIDKAEPDVPNDLLEVLGINEFPVDDAPPHKVQRKQPPAGTENTKPNFYGSLLLVITTNQERDLPPAFVRRCAVHTIAAPESEEAQIERLEKIAKLHMSGLMQQPRQSAKVLRQVARKYMETRRQPAGSGRRGPNIAEYLDAIRVCLRLRITPESTVWKQIEENLFVK